MSVRIHVTSPDTSSERTYDLSMTTKLEFVTGIFPGAQILTLCHSEADPRVIRTLDDESKPLGFYGLENGMLLKVTHKDPSRSEAGLFSDLTQVEKFELSPEEYERRQDTVLAYKKLHKMGRFAAPAPDDAPSTPPVAPSHHIVVGSRCEVDVDGFKKRGTVRFVGNTKFGKGGEWVGVEYDEPVGKNDGSVQGERYFTCKPNYGGFVRADKVTVGEFPEEELDVEEM